MQNWIFTNEENWGKKVENSHRTSTIHYHYLVRKRLKNKNWLALWTYPPNLPLVVVFLLGGLNQKKCSLWLPWWKYKLVLACSPAMFIASDGRPGVIQSLATLIEVQVVIALLHCSARSLAMFIASDEVPSSPLLVNPTV